MSFPAVNGDGMSKKKIAICGKGGSGKSTVVALLAHALRDRGFRVLVVDADESNPGLHRMLGMEKRPQPLLELVGGKRKVFQAFSDESESPDSVLTRERIATSDLPSEFVEQHRGIRLVCVGKILQSLEGCACPMGALSREFLNRLWLQDDEVALVDTEAGIEHFGRGVETSVDTVIAVTEPSFDSIELSAKIGALAAEVGLDGKLAILNKVRSEELGSKLRHDLQKRGLAVIGSIGYEPEVFDAALEGRPVRGGRLETDIARILDQLL
jgi:CO dehydrogenase maturation factor